jgi:hypothetical protein
MRELVAASGLAFSEADIFLLKLAFLGIFG